jgi:hypothetical protein
MPIYAAAHVGYECTDYAVASTDHDKIQAWIDTRLWSVERVRHPVWRDVTTWSIQLDGEHMTYAFVDTEDEATQKLNQFRDGYFTIHEIPEPNV